jgi:sorting nexin-8
VLTSDDPPALYLSLLDSLEPQPSGTIPLSSVHRLLSTARLPASTIEHILTLTAREASYLSRTEFFCALALVALAQSSHPDEAVNLERLSQSIPTLPLPNLSPASPRVPVPTAFTPGDTPGTSPWDTAPRQNGNAHSYLDAGPNGAPSGFSDIDQPGGNGALDVEGERGYWKKLEKVEVSLVPQKEGWFLQKYTVTSDVRGVPSA